MTSENNDKVLEIYVNRRKFQSGDGVKPEMTGGELAALINVPEDNAVVKLETRQGRIDIPVNDKVQIKSGMEFLITRRTVDGGQSLRTC